MIPMPLRPPVLILSSTEGLPVAQAAQHLLHDLGCEPTVWNQIALDGWLLEAILSMIASCPFVIVVTSPDDFVEHKGTRVFAPRDNVILEFGISATVHGSKQTFVLCPDGPDIKLPTDIQGLVRRTYAQRADKNYAAALTRACSDIASSILRAVSDGLWMGPLMFFNAIIDLNSQIMVNPSTRIAPDIVIGINHGGAVIAGLLHYLNRRRFAFTVWSVGEGDGEREDAQRSELRLLIEKVPRRSKPTILLVDDTLRSGRALTEALRRVRRWFPKCVIRVGVVVYRPDLAKHYRPEDIETSLYTPTAARFPQVFQGVFYER